MSIQEQAVHKAIALLNAAGAKYRIEFEKLEYDTLPIQANRRVHSNNWVKLTNYREQVQKLKPGEVLTWGRNSHHEFKESRDWSSFIASVGHAGREYFGKENFILNRTEVAIEIMRVE